VNFREKMHSGNPVLGSWINTGSTVVAELMAQLPFDFLTLDAEHSPIGVAEVHALSQAIRAGGRDCACLVRLPGTRYETVKRFMDAGAQGVIAPMVNTREQAQEVVDAVKYPPHGRRGVGFAPSNGYGLRLAGHLAGEHRQSAVIVQIEHVDALRNLDAILSVPGVDGAMIGPYDLSASMGKAGAFDDPELVAATTAIREACARNKVCAGIHVVQPNPDEAVARIAQGFRFIAYSLDITMLAACASAGLAAIRGDTGA